MPIRSLTALCLALLVAAGVVFVSRPAHTQGVIDAEENWRIETVRVTIANPSADTELNKRVEDRFRRTISIYPADRYSTNAVEFALARARRAAEIADATYDISFGQTGGVNLDFTLTLREEAAAPRPRGMLATGDASDLPVLYDVNGAFLKLKLESLVIHYGNGNAWYGRPDALLAGNPLVVGQPSGKGYKHWVEGFVHIGLYGIAPVTDKLYVYGGASVLASGSYGQELFTDETRGHIGVEDAYVGFITGRTSEAGNRFVLNASIGRQRFTLGDGFLIVNTSANGHDRAALQSNPRWAADLLALVQIRYNNIRLEVFRVDPDELPVVDSKTVIDGVNLETRLTDRLDVAASFLRVPRSNFGYFTLSDTFSREGLQVYDVRFRWQLNPPGRAGPFLAGEAALQRNENFDMIAYGFYGEVGWYFANMPWLPTLSYRYAQFSGDDPDTRRFERWDPLLSGGTGEQWVQGINHFKVVQNSNVKAHRLQLRLRPTPKIELVPQAWLFRAESLTNLGGNPALSFLGSGDLGYEFNLTAKYFMSRQVFIQGHVAATFPGDAVTQALGKKPDPWWSTMLFVRVAF